MTIEKAWKVAQIERKYLFSYLNFLATAGVLQCLKTFCKRFWVQIITAEPALGKHTELQPCPLHGKLFRLCGVVGFIGGRQKGSRQCQMLGGCATAVILQAPWLAAKNWMLIWGQVNVGSRPCGGRNSCWGNAMASGGPAGGKLHMYVGQMDAAVG